jgi:hypothetical protein
MNSICLTPFLYHLNPPQSANTSLASDALAPPTLAIYPTREALFEAIQRWSKPRGYAFTITRSKKLRSGRQKVYYACDLCPPVRPPRVDSICDTQ